MVSKGVCLTEGIINKGAFWVEGIQEAGEAPGLATGESCSHLGSLLGRGREQSPNLRGVAVGQAALQALGGNSALLETQQGGAGRLITLTLLPPLHPRPLITCGCPNWNQMAGSWVDAVCRPGPAEKGRERVWRGRESTQHSDRDSACLKGGCQCSPPSLTDLQVGARAPPCYHTGSEDLSTECIKGHTASKW